VTLTIHIGLPKTASTHLQKEIFPNLLSEDQYAFGERAKELLRLGPDLPKRTSLISAEAWSNSLFGNGYQKNFSQFLSLVNNLQRDDIRILFFIRNHEDWLASAYLQLAKAAFNKPRSFREHLSSFSEIDLSWLRRIEDLKGFRLLVIRFEDFIKSPEGYTEKIGNFIGATPKNSADQDESNKRINLSPKTRVSLGLVRGITVTTELPDLALKRIFGRRFIFGGNGRADFCRVWARDSLIKATDSLPGLKPIKDVLISQVPDSMRHRFQADMRECQQYICS
jgi:hypothetical protein